MTKKKPKQKKVCRTVQSASPLLMRLMPAATPPERMPETAEDAPATLLSLLPQLTVSPGHLASVFALPEKLHAFKAADIWWADNVVRQFEGTDVLRPGAHEKLREWYNQYAREYYKKKRRAAEKEARRKQQEQEQQVIEAEPEDKATRH